jgi:hypothetical protein
MTRRHPLDRWNSDAQNTIAPIDTLSTIPLSEGHKRDNHTWDRAHRVHSYFIPSTIHEQAKDVRASILGLAHQHMTTITSVASALMSYSLTHVRQGKLVIEARPNGIRRKMALTWEATDEWPQEIPLPEKQNKRGRVDDVYLGFRWSKDVDMQIKALAGKAISVGEALVFLLRYALAAHQSGRLRLKEEAVVVSQKVSSTW